MKKKLKINKEKGYEYQDCYGQEIISSDNTNIAESERFVKRLKLQMEVIKKIIDPENVSLSDSENDKSLLK
jgi:hypothetical protein